MGCFAGLIWLLVGKWCGWIDCFGSWLRERRGGRRSTDWGFWVSDGGFHLYPDSARTPRGDTYHVFLQREGVLVTQAERAVQAKADPEHPSLLLHDRKSVPAYGFAIDEDRGSL